MDFGPIISTILTGCFGALGAVVSAGHISKTSLDEAARAKELLTSTAKAADGLDEKSLLVDDIELRALRGLDWEMRDHGRFKLLFGGVVALSFTVPGFAVILVAWEMSILQPVLATVDYEMQLRVINELFAGLFPILVGSFMIPLFVAICLLHYKRRKIDSCSRALLNARKKAVETRNANSSEPGTNGCGKTTIA